MDEPIIDIISIGTLARNRLWKESAPKRTPHATTTLLRVGKRTVLVDPALPPQVLRQRLDERVGLAPEKIDAVFLTTLLPHHRGGIELFPNAEWLADERELVAVAGHLKTLLERGDEDMATVLRKELEFLGRMKPAQDQLAPQVDLFPLPGITAGTCGLLVQERSRTTLLTGPAVASRDHFLAGQILPEPSSLAAAQESLTEVFEIADVVIPGYDNAFVSPRGYGGLNV